jgi:hypothetical protein
VLSSKHAKDNNTNVVSSSGLFVNRADGGYFAQAKDGESFVYTESGVSVDVSSVGRVSDDISLASLSIVPQGTDTITSIVIGDIPVGAILSDGVNSSDGIATTVDIVGWDYSNLTVNFSVVSPAPTADTAISFTVSATAESVTAKTATASSTISVGILSDNYLEYGANVVDNIISNSVVAGSDDLEIGSATNDTITVGTQGAVILHGLAGDDVLNGGDNNLLDDSLNGNNLLFGGAGNDTIIAGSGEDIIVSGIGSDNLTGGFSGGGVESDTDTFLWKEGDQGAGINGVNLETDTVTDFVVGSTATGGDILGFSQLLIGETAATIGDYITLSETGGNTLLSIDVNGDASGIDFNVQLNGVTGTDINALINNGNIVFDTVDGTTARSSLRGGNGSDTFVFEADDVYTGSKHILMRDFKLGVVGDDGASEQSDVLDLSDFLIGATEVTIDNYLNIEFNSYGRVDVIHVYQNSIAVDGIGNPSFKLDMVDTISNDLNSVNSSQGNYASNAAAFNTVQSLIDTSAILDKLILGGNLIVE